MSHCSAFGDETAPAISVLMSMRNGMPFVKQTIASIIGQTFTDWEGIVVDNASQDGSAEYVAQVAQTEPRIRLLRNERDLGHSGGLNRGLAVCRGKWIARMDADDIALPNRFERQLGFVQSHPDVRVTSCLAYYIDSQGRRVGKTVCDLITRDDFERYQTRIEPMGILHPGAFIDRLLLLEVNGYRPEFDPANDIDLWARLSERALILVQPEYLLEYRVHKDSVSAQGFLLARNKTQWIRACMRARRSGAVEPTWQEFLAERRSAPWWLKINRWRKTSAKRLYRQSGLHFVNACRIRALLEMGAATLLEPTYAVPKIKDQFYKI